MTEDERRQYDTPLPVSDAEEKARVMLAARFEAFRRGEMLIPLSVCRAIVHAREGDAPPSV